MNYKIQTLITTIKGFRKGTIAMTVVSVMLVLWIGVVWWQDKRTAPQLQELQARIVEVEMFQKPAEEKTSRERL